MAQPQADMSENAATISPIKDHRSVNTVNTTGKDLNFQSGKGHKPK